MNPADLQDLPDEVREVIERPQKLRAEELAGLATHITTLRDEAVAARKESGIEQTWAECEEAYLGIDDLTRAEFGGAKWAKPMAMEGGLVKMTQPGDSTKATAFVMVTARYVDAGTAKVCEVSLPIDGKPFTLKATPVPELSAAAEDKTPAEQVTGQPMPGPDGQPVSVDTLAKHQISVAEAAAREHRHQRATGGEHRPEHQADHIADAAGGMLVEHRRVEAGAAPVEHVAAVAHCQRQNGGGLGRQATRAHRHRECTHLRVAQAPVGDAANQGPDLGGRRHLSLAHPAQDFLRLQQFEFGLGHGRAPAANVDSAAVAGRRAQAARATSSLASIMVVATRR